MCLPTFGFYKKEVHHEIFTGNHACGNVCPGDDFVSDVSRVTCKHCLAKILADEVVAVDVKFHINSLPTGLT